jgi:two-component sensor histidine kinase
VELPADQALALTLAFHELGTNAAKYGALSRDTGRVDISWSVVDSGGQRQLSLSWVEQGGPPVKQPTARGFGSCLIEDALASAFRGTPKLTFDPAGVRWMLVAPVTAVGAQSAS